jgi:hypothetical protein
MGRSGLAQRDILLPRVLGEEEILQEADEPQSCAISEQGSRI